LIVYIHFPPFVQTLIVLSSDPEIIFLSEDIERERTASLCPGKVPMQLPD
jgi:hypothetical protein